MYVYIQKMWNIPSLNIVLRGQDYIVCRRGQLVGEENAYMNWKLKYKCLSAFRVHKILK